jgi:hypothetical protein
MGLLDFLRGKKETKKTKEETPESAETSLLEELCKGDTNLFNALSHTLLLNPQRLVKEGIESQVKQAEESRKNKDLLRARIHYQAAGEIALYEGKLEQMREFFKKCAELEADPEYKKVFTYFSRKANAEKALKVAQEYYAQTAKSPGRKGP